MTSSSTTFLPKVALALVHYPILDKQKNIVATNITNFDIHDIARAATVYGVEKYFIVHPMKEQQMFVDRILDHWRTGQGSQFNPSRKRSLKGVQPAGSLEEALRFWGEVNPLVIGTHARSVSGTQLWSCADLKSEIFLKKRAVFLVFGTGYGLTEETMQALDGVLESLRGAPPEDFRHLSVRSAVSIYLDRILGPW